MKKNYFKIILTSVLCMTLLSGCNFNFLGNNIHKINASIVGNSYDIYFYSNKGEKFMEMSGEKIDLSCNDIYLPFISLENIGYIETMSSVMTITIDGNEVESCGSTVILCEEGLDSEVDISMGKIESNSDGIFDYTIFSKAINEYDNYMGKSRVVLIQSQLGDPICAYYGDNVYWEVCNDIPETTKLIIDGKALYIHKANFQIIDAELLN